MEKKSYERDGIRAARNEIGIKRENRSTKIEIPSLT